LGLLALFWQKDIFWDFQEGISLIHEEPALVKVGDDEGLAQRPGGLADAVSGGIAEQDQDAGVVRPILQA